MDLLDYRVGSSLRLDIYGENGESLDHIFVSQVEEVIDAYEAYIAVPIVEGVVYAVRTGWALTAYMREGNNFYRFSARVMQRLQQDGRALLRILRLSEIEIAQRRRYYRFKCTVPFKYRVITNLKTDLNAPFKECRTADLSGSGLSFSTKARLDMDSLIECELTIDRKPIYLVGNITRCARGTEEDADRYDYQIGVYFSDVEEAKREMIIKFIFNEERRIMKRGIA